MLPTEAPSEVVPAVEIPQLNLPVEDGVPLESPWHRKERQATWLRFFDADGELVLIRAEAERQRAEAAEQRADTLEAELERTRARLAELEDES